MRDVTNAVDPKNENANDDLRIFQRETYPSDYPSTEFICAWWYIPLNSSICLGAFMRPLGMKKTDVCFVLTLL